MRDAGAVWGGRAVSATAVACLAFLWLPVAVLVVFSFTASTKPHVWDGASTRWYAALLDPAQNADVRRVAGNSFTIATCVALVATVLGTTWALGVHRRARTRPTRLHDVATAVPILVPDVVQGVALLSGFAVAFSLIQRLTGAAPTLGRWSVVVAHTAFASSYVAILVRTRLRTIPAALEEAALDLGATPSQTFRRVTLPLIAPAVLGGALLAFTLSLDEYVLTFFTSGPGCDTFPVWIASAVRRAQATPMVNAVSALLVVGSGLLLTLTLAFQRRPR